MPLTNTFPGPGVYPDSAASPGDDMVPVTPEDPPVYACSEILPCSENLACAEIGLLGVFLIPVEAS